MSPKALPLLIVSGAAVPLLAPLARAQLPFQVGDPYPASAAPGPVGSSPSGMTPFGGDVLYSAAAPGQGAELFRAGPAAGVLSQIADLRPGFLGSTPSFFTLLGDFVVFVADDGVHGEELWRTDGTAAGTIRLGDIAPGAASAAITEIVRFGDRVYFPASTGSTRGLWTSDGTPAGTHMVREAPFTDQFSPSLLTPSGANLYFTVVTFGGGGQSLQIWMSDGTGAGTLLVRNFPSTLPLTSPPAPIGSGGLVFNIRAAFRSDEDLWSTDGSIAGTQMIRHIQIGPRLHSFTSLGVQVAFFDYRPTEFDLWLTDGTAEGTASVHHWSTPVRIAAPPAPLILLGDRLFFAADTPDSGHELWTSDLTDAGTRIVADLVPGAQSSDPSDLMVAQGSLYFSASTPATGRELYRASPDGTSIDLVADILPGPQSSNPQELALAGNMLVFSATGPTGGQELWALTLTPPCPADFDGDGLVFPDDLSEFITCFFLQVQFPGFCPRADFNGDGLVFPDDLSEFITTFFMSAC